MSGLRNDNSSRDAASLTPGWTALVLLLASMFFWAYWPTMLLLFDAWNREPDYSHGFLVAPVALFFLWANRASFPGLGGSGRWIGLFFIALSVALRSLGALLYLDAMDAWSMLLWLLGAAWLLGGYSFFRWALPAIGFLGFMIPLPFRVEHFASYTLQRVATKLSCWMLLAMGEPAIPEGNVILLGDHRMQVSEACSGLRIFVGIVALAAAYMILLRRSWWEKALLLLAVVPVSLIANATRIVVAGLLWRRVSGKAAQVFIHDVSGFLMIPFAALLFVCVLWYLDRLFPRARPVDVRELWREKRLATSK